MTHTNDGVMAAFDALADTAYIRASQLVQDPKQRNAPTPLPFSLPTLWRKTRNGTFPQPVKLSDRVTAWKVGDVRAWIAGISGQADAEIKRPESVVELNPWGMRDHFAASIIGGLYASHNGNPPEPEQMAEDAYLIADAMIEARQQ